MNEQKYIVYASNLKCKERSRATKLEVKQQTSCKIIFAYILAIFFSGKMKKNEKNRSSLTQRSMFGRFDIIVSALFL